MYHAYTIYVVHNRLYFKEIIHYHIPDNRHLNDATHLIQVFMQSIENQSIINFIKVTPTEY